MSCLTTDLQTRKIIKSTKDQSYMVGIRNKLSIGDTIEILSPKGRAKRIKIAELLDMHKNPIDSAHPNTIAILKLGIQCHPDDIVRKI